MNADSLIQMIKLAKKNHVDCLEITSKFLILCIAPSKIQLVSEAIIVHLNNNWLIPFSQVEKIENC